MLWLYLQKRKRRLQRDIEGQVTGSSDISLQPRVVDPPAEHGWTDISLNDEDGKTKTKAGGVSGRGKTLWGTPRVVREKGERTCGL